MRKRNAKLAVAVLIALQLAFLNYNAWHTGPGWDEWGHLPSGLFTLQFGDSHPYRVNPPLVRLIAAVPVALSGGAIDFAVLPKAPGFRSEGYLGMAYIHQQGADIFAWMSIARMAVIPIAVFGTWLIWKIAKHFGNPNSGFFAAGLWVFSPLILTYGATITPDIGGTVFGIWAAWCFYTWFRTGKLRHAIWVGVSIAAALLSKSTWIILPPIVAMVLLLRWMVGQSRMTWKKESSHWALIALISFVLIHTAYDFRGILQPIGKFDFISQALSGNDNSDRTEAPIPGNRFRGTAFGWIPSPLPAQYIAGIDVQKRDFEVVLGSYLMGTRSDRGWWYYYVVAWLVKEPLAFWFILATGWSGLLLKRKRRWKLGVKLRGLMMVAAPGFLVFCFVSSQTGFNHHLRYVLPAFPAAFLIASYPIARVTRSFRLGMLVLLVWFSVSSSLMVPRSYAYFSEAIGGWRNGHLYLNASNLDWGQDLPTIREWVRNNPDKRPVYLLYSPENLDFNRLGIDARIGDRLMSNSGPKVDGWWLVSIDKCLTKPNDWFLHQTPDQRLSVSTTVYHIDRYPRDAQESEP